MPSRIDFIWSMAGSGWSEQWYHPNNDPLAALNALDIRAANNTVQKFFALRGKGTLLQAVRATSTVAPFGTRLFVVQLAPEGVVRNAPATAAEPTDCVLGQAKTTNLHRRQVQVRGLKDYEVERDVTAQTVFGPDFLADLTAFRQAVIAWGLQVRFLKKPTNLNPLRRVLSMERSGDFPNSTRFYYDNGPQLAADQPVLIKRMPRRTQPGYSGPLLPVKITATYFDVPILYRNADANIVLQGVQVFTAAYDFETIDNIAWLMMREKKVGRPFGTPHGRRPGLVFRAR